MTQIPSALVRTPLAGLGRPLTDPEATSLDNYLKLLTKWQKSQRLVGSTDRAWLIENVVVDSLCFLGALPRTARRIADVGSGAGIPGIPLSIVRPELAFALIESRARRASFLSACIRELSLANTVVMGARVEDLAEVNAATFDAVVMRCAGDMSQLMPHVMRLLVPDGVVVASGPPEDRLGDGAEVLEVPRADLPARRLRLWRRSDFGR